jgi:hypothetical protein
VTNKFNLYIGKAGHLAVMSEFLMRGWNVATPEVDIGDDIFVVQDENGLLRRVQVKTSTAIIRKGSFSGQFQVSLKQLKTETDSLVYYVFISRYNNTWTKPIIIRQDALSDHFLKDKVGTEHKGNINFYFSYIGEKVECSGKDFSKYICDYVDFPLVEH